MSFINGQKRFEFKSNPREKNDVGCEQRESEKKYGKKKFKEILE